MRIVGGRWAGRDLLSPSGPVRPTSEPLRDAAMELLADRVVGARVIDLFAGTGALGIEALSRGARTCDFVENHPAALHALKANVTALRLKRRTRVFKRDVIQFVQRVDAFRCDIALADPPYGSRKVDRIIDDWRDHPFATLLLVEHAAQHSLPIRPVARTRVDDSVVSLFEHQRHP